jgi:amidohydrolase
VTLVADDANERTRAFVETHRDELVALRRHLHAHPELSNEEVETTDLVAARLQAAGLDPQVLPGGVGLFCDIGGGDGGDGPVPVVALRADLDALAMDDESDVPFRSKRPGIAHACGHDVHTTVVLGAGLALKEHLVDHGRARGRVRLLFESAEEAVPSGAADLITAGAMDDVCAVYGLHCDPKRDVGTVGVRAGPLTAASDLLTIDLHGPGGHTARPQLTVDLVQVAARLATALPHRVEDRVAATGAGLFVFGSLRAGDAPNVIPSRARLAGTFRTHSPASWALAAEVIPAEVAAILEGTGATFELDHQRGVPPVVNDAAETARFSRAARSVLGDDAVAEAPQSWGGDSFAWYLDHAPGTYARLGIHDPTRDGDREDLHSSTFHVDERAIDVGIEVLVATALDALADHTQR